MNRPNTYHYTTPEGLQLHAVTGPERAGIDSQDWGHVWENGLNEGWPGFVLRGAMTEDQVRAYIGAPDGAEYPTRQRGVGVYSTYNGRSELTGYARYGRTMTSSGLEVQDIHNIPSAHLPTFTVARETRGYRRLEDDEMRAVGTVLAHQVILDALAQGYARMGYKIEGVTLPAVDAEVARLSDLAAAHAEELGELSLKPYPYTIDPSFAVPVQDREAMVRREKGFDIASYRTILEFDNPWLADSPAQAQVS